MWDSHMAVWQTEDDGKIKGMKDPKSFKQKTSAYQIPTRLQSPLATPYPAVKRNVAYNTACEARNYSWLRVEGCTMVLGINKLDGFLNC